MKEIIKKNKELLVAILIVLVLIVSGTYAWLRLTRESERVNVIKAGTLSLKLDDTAREGIKLENSIPMSYSQGMATDEYTFTLTNDGTTAVDFEIVLNDVASYVNDNDETVTIDDTNRLGDNNIRFILLKNGEEPAPEKSMLLSQDPGRIIDVGTIEKGATITYSMRVWINSQSTNDEVMGKLFNSALSVNAQQHS